MPDTLLGGCVSTATIDGREMSIHYLRLLQLIDHVSREIPLNESRSLLEIGGGFGANVHLQLELFPTLRKVVYLDIPPNLYVGTSYLRSLYGPAVRDYTETRSLDRIPFRDDDSLEIIAICPWQIEALDLHVDVFWNAHSFVEMPAAVVANYAERVLALPGAQDTSIVLATYDGGSIPNTIPPDRLPAAFAGRDFAAGEYALLGWPIPGHSDPQIDATVLTFVSAA